MYTLRFLVKPARLCIREHVQVHTRVDEGDAYKYARYLRGGCLRHEDEEKAPGYWYTYIPAGSSEYV